MSKSVGMRISNRDLVHVYTMANNAQLSGGAIKPEAAARKAAESVELFKRWAVDQPDLDDMAEDVQRKILHGE